MTKTGLTESCIDINININTNINIKIDILLNHLSENLFLSIIGYILT